jgi:peptidoglycan/xylan/chitin deacetylase (PgdA/CDA1 family)
MATSRFGGRRAACTLSFDDARASQLTVAAPILGAHGVRASFYVLPEPVRADPAPWIGLLASGHELGNHSSTHPCSGNFAFSRANALEEHDSVTIAADIDAASAALTELCATTPATFAYPCGQSFVGRGAARTSYVPLVAERFIAGRGYGAETANDPDRCDLAHLEGIAIDGLGVAELDALLADALRTGSWLVLVAHDVGSPGYQTLDAHALDRFCASLAGEPDVLSAPLAEVARALIAS